MPDDLRWCGSACGDGLANRSLPRGIGSSAGERKLAVRQGFEPWVQVLARTTVQQPAKVPRSRQILGKNRRLALRDRRREPKTESGAATPRKGSHAASGFGVSLHDIPGSRIGPELAEHRTEDAGVARRDRRRVRTAVPMVSCEAQVRGVRPGRLGRRVTVYPAVTATVVLDHGRNAILTVSAKNHASGNHPSWFTHDAGA
jgi:hypothetical protein